MKIVWKKISRLTSATAALIVVLFSFAVLTAFSGFASADDIQISASVVASTPTAAPIDSVKLPVGQDATSAPVVTIQIVGLEPYSFVQVFAQSEPILIASGFADKYGVFTCKAPLPSSLEAGSHAITASTQLKGETTASIKTLVKFDVSASGTIGGPKSGGGGTGGGNAGGGGSGGGTNGGGGTGGGTTASPTSSPSVIVAQGESYGGILVVGGFVVDSRPTWSVDGATAKLHMTLENSYSKPYRLGASFKVRNFLGLEIARSNKIFLSNFKAKETKTIELETSSKIGQWGAYSAEINIVPPKKIDNYQLQTIVRVNDFFVWPIVPASALLILLTAAVLRRIFWVKFVGRLPSRKSQSASGDGE
jgi:hypothetical protein